ncbi:Putative short-chain dehydrogenase/reductase SDR, NAD(P)-binding domain superfamily [Septoria linicola]|uniref:Short-chain dehydrogenase/reductase SDR, NAD(P)-binding domain superfamily n=1 Tax=Septoria linicola TaxID=215465 RepID=A0A9Q9APP9_9PEZI|nr:putative short-chain dehydrogenase/reductase SDR, NAD(P)-binding domain superfamily [Septoria linicola]USW52179.1 Putative short-chain dehydrogenase/reductase SDR, NAD(P)-binding domain superfamily [Septoria linicola]
MPTAVITGCNSGIGHATAQILKGEGYHIYALDVVVGDKLKALEGTNIHISEADVTNPDSIARFRKTIGDTPIDVLLNVAGEFMPDPTSDTLETVSLSTIQKSFAINACGPLLLTQALLSNILSAPVPRRVAVVSSRIGSIADNSSGGMYAYRASKCAVNCFFKTLAVELRDKVVVVTMLHPGFTNTNLDADIGKVPGVVEPEVSAAGLWKVVKGTELAKTGKVWHRDGYELPW